MEKLVSVPPVIVVVDDEPIIRLDAVATIDDAGFLALEAADAEKALEVLAAHPEVSVLFTDINMLGSFDGLELARRVHQGWPGVQLVITSGRDAPVAEEMPDHGHFVAKPYQTIAIIALLRSVCR
jgi:CheY-like chemotaxis protein